MKIKFTLEFTPDIELNNQALNIDVNDKFDTAYISELFVKKIKKIISTIKQTEEELF